MKGSTEQKSPGSVERAKSYNPLPVVEDVEDDSPSREETKSVNKLSKLADKDGNTTSETNENRRSGGIVRNIGLDLKPVEFKKGVSLQEAVSPKDAMSRDTFNDMRMALCPDSPTEN